MTARNGLWVANGAAGVTAPQDARLALAGLLSTSGAGPLDAGPGVLYGPGNPGQVTGSTSGPTMKYTVAAGVFATQRGTSADGLYLWANDGALTVDSGAAAPGSGSRYDLIYARAKNANDGFGDANSTPEILVAVGTASGSPTRPTVPAGGLVLAEAVVGTSIANASLATITQVAPWKVARGAAIPVRNQTERDALTGRVGMRVLRLDITAALVEEVHNGTTWTRKVSCSGVVQVTPSAANTPTSLAIVFPAGLFSAIPVVVVGPNTAVPGTTVTGVAATGASTAGCLIWVTRANTTATLVDYIAMQDS